MKVLMFSADKNILKEDSAVWARMADYGSICDELHVVIPTLGGPKEKIQISKNVFVYPTASFTKIGSRLYFFTLGKKITADLVTVQDPFETGFMAWLTARRIGAKLELQIHTDFLSPSFARESFLNKIRIRLAKFLLPKADGIRVVSDRIKNSLKVKGYKLKVSPVVLPIYVDIETIRKTEPKINLKNKYPQFNFICLVASRLTKEKNISLAISAFREVIKKHPKAGLVIVGSGPEEQPLKDLVRDWNMAESVIFEPWQDDIVSYYKTADTFILTSNYEGFGLSLVEAAASDCPIISTNVGIIGGILKDSNHVLTCQVGNTKCIAGHINMLIEHTPLRREVSQRAQTDLETFPKDKELYLQQMREAWENILLKR